MIDKKTVEHVAKLARLRLSEQEIEKFTRELSAIEKAFSKIKQANTDKVEPSFQPLPLENVMRDDSAEPSLSQEQALANTDEYHKEQNQFKGPKVV